MKTDALLRELHRHFEETGAEKPDELAMTTLALIELTGRSTYRPVNVNIPQLLQQKVLHNG